MMRRPLVVSWFSLLGLMGGAAACQGGGDEDGAGGSDGSGGSDMGGSGSGGTEPVGEVGCQEPTGEGTAVSGTIDGDVTWTPEGSPYVVSGIAAVEGDLLLEACTVVLLEEDAGFEVSGSMTARGLAEEDEQGELVLSPVVFASAVAGEPWGSIDVEVSGLLDLELTTLFDGGSQEATIHAYGEDQYGLPHRNVRVHTVSIASSLGYGVMLETRAGFTEDSAELLIEASGSEEAPFPIYVEAGAVDALPSTVTFSGNVVDEILVAPVRQVEEDTLRNLGYPYRIRGPLLVARENGVTSEEISSLTIEPGVTLRMEDSAGSGLLVGSGEGNLGRLIAVGTEEEPIVFESAADEPAPADWLGLYFRAPVATGNELEFVHVVHAGGFSGAQGYGCGPIENHASILILNAEPVSPFIQNVTIEQAGGDTQILLGWDYDGDAAGSAQAIFEANTFDENGPACHVSLPQDATSQCPGLDDEPDCL